MDKFFAGCFISNIITPNGDEKTTDLRFLYLQKTVALVLSPESPFKTVGAKLNLEVRTGVLYRMLKG
jgi:hypothetical protein